MVVKVWEHPGRKPEVFSGSKAAVEDELARFGFHNGEVRHILTHSETYLDGGDLYVTCEK